MLWGRFRTALVLVCAVGALAACGKPEPETLLAQARADYAKGDHRSAIVLAKVVLEAQPERAEARLLLGRALLAAGDTPLAVVELAKARDLGTPLDEVVPALAMATARSVGARRMVGEFGGIQLAQPRAAAELKTTLAAAHIGLQDVAKAEAMLDEALALSPDHVDAKLLKMRIVAARDPDAAAAMVETLLKEQPKVADAWQIRGELLWTAKGDLAAAAQAFEEALKVDPKHAPAHMALIGMELAREDVEGYRTRLSAMRRDLPGHPETRFQDARLAMLEGKLDQARELIQPILRVQPDSARALQLAGAIDLQGSALVNAEINLLRAVQLAPEVAASRLLLAKVHLRLSQPQRAIAVLQPLLATPQPGSQALGLLAEAHVQAGRLAEAEDAYQRAAAAAPKDTRTRTALALTRIAQGRDADGLTQLRDIAASDAATYADLALVNTHLRRGELEPALQAVQRLQAKLPDAALPHLLRGDVLVRQRDTAAARASFERALSLAPKDFAAVRRLASLDLGANRVDDALRRVQTHWNAEPRDYAALRTLVDLRQRHGDATADSVKLLQDAVARQPGDAPPRLMLVEQLLRLPDPPQALVAAQQGAAALPDSLEMQAALGQAQLAAGEAQQAVNIFVRLATTQASSVAAQLQLAEAHISLRDYAQGRQVLRRALEIDPRSLAAQRTMAQLEMTDKRPAEALRIARTVQQQRPNEIAGYQLEADIQAAEKRPDAVAAAWQTAFSRRPETETAIRYHAALLQAGQRAEAERLAGTWRQRHPGDMAFATHLGTTALQSGDFARAERQYRQVLDGAPDDAVALNNLAFAMLRQGKPEALETARRADAKRPNDPRIMDTLAAALAQSKQLPEALALQRRAVAAASDSAIYRLHLAELLIQSGDKTAAKTELEALRRLGGRFSESQRVNEMLRTL